MRLFSSSYVRSVCGSWLLALATAAASALSAQTLARPGWAGSGITAETWWHNALFYRITPATFQDTDGDGKGDLRGIAQRMLYLQSLSVDAVVLDSPFDSNGFDDLIGEASRRHIRLLVALSATNDGSVVAEARSWLARGCAGIWLRVPPGAAAAHTALLIHDLRVLTDSFPGQRVLVEDASADSNATPSPGAQLVTRLLAASVGKPFDAPTLRTQLGQLNDVPQGSAPLVLLRQEETSEIEDAKHRQALEKIFASMLLLFHGAAVIDAGQEIDNSTRTTAAHVMQWTPSNLTRATAAAETPPVAPPKPRSEDDYGPFVPYVAPKKPIVAGSDFDALPGFSTVGAESNSAALRNNVAHQDATVDSLLNFYRQLSHLHHGDAAFSSGGTLLLNRDTDDVLAWVRKPPANARASSVAFVVCNLADSAKNISFQPDFTASPKQNLGLIPLLSSTPANMQVLQRPSSVAVAPWSFVVLSVSH